MALAILATPSFARVVKKLHPQDKAVLDTAVQAIAADPALGDEKRGDLNGVFVYKFKLNKQETLLAYRLQPDKLVPEALVLLANKSISINY
ncbi:MAG: type II toxin-antitoxin system RelE/ParE family toxin [Rhodoferax sp.]|nr:type II toxin-antitoxin system RelE/ParE family toxin [Rhodoferax sp.]